MCVYIVFQGTISTSDFNLECPVASKKSQPTEEVVSNDDVMLKRNVPQWKALTTNKGPFKVILDMKEDLKDPLHGSVVIPKEFDSSTIIGSLMTREESSICTMALTMEEAATLKNKKISVLGLVLSFEEKTGRLVLADSDYEASKKIFATLNSMMKGSIVGQVEVGSGKAFKRQNSPAPSITPCNVMFSNALRFDPHEEENVCISQQLQQERCM